VTGLRKVLTVNKEMVTSPKKGDYKLQKGADISLRLRLSAVKD
jgi:hypothetical protein